MNIAKKCNKVIVILGPTGSGKTEIAIKIARAIGGEIISADSRAIYKGMDIGTMKPSMMERQGVPHFGLDLVEPGERFTVSDFKSYALEKITEIKKRGQIPIIVGGTGLYIDALVYDYQFKSVVGGSQKKQAPDRGRIDARYLLIGIKWEKEELRKRLKERVNKLFVQDLYFETGELVKKYGFFNGAMTANIYKYAWGYLQGEISLEEAKERCFYADWHLARRQMTWFRRTLDIHWLELEKIYPFVLECIQDE